jgi:competence protein ComK
LKRDQEIYEVTKHTMAILSSFNQDSQALVLDVRGEFHVKQTPMQIIRAACLEGRETYEGRRKAVMHHTSITQKVPIPINIFEQLIAFPTYSPTQIECVWIFYNKIKAIEPRGERSAVIFLNDHILELDLSFYTLERQMQRTAYCEFRFLRPQNADQINNERRMIQ